MIRSSMPSIRRTKPGKRNAANVLFPLLVAGIWTQGAIAQLTDRAGLGLSGPDAPPPFLQVTPRLQYIANPAYDLTTDEIVVLGLRVRVAF